MDVSIVGDIIRWPFEFLGSATIFLIKNLIPILIVAGSLFLSIGYLQVDLLIRFLTELY